MYGLSEREVHFRDPERVGVPGARGSRKRFGRTQFGLRLRRHRATFQG